MIEKERSNHSLRYIATQRMDPVIFELTAFQQRKIQPQVPDENSFDLANCILNIPVASVAEASYALQFELNTLTPIELQLLSAEEITGTPKPKYRLLTLLSGLLYQKL
ncbi:MAG: hypothetical protein KJN90_01875 [Gammaproteobacteria bacterium]|nr:hypothetical protein [Gammaproteobacteria bacterium]